MVSRSGYNKVYVYSDEVCCEERDNDIDGLWAIKASYPFVYFGLYTMVSLDTISPYLNMEYANA